MDSGELLDELRHNILHDRSDQIDGNASDQLWSDATLIRYINEAQRKFAREALVIHDNTTPSATQVTLLDGVADYTLDPSVLAVVSARYVGDTGDLTRTGHSALSAYTPPNTAFFDPSTYGSFPPGKPLAFSTDEGFGLDSLGSSGVVQLHLYPTPSASFLNGLRLRVIRLPIEDLYLDEPTSQPEIPDAHHLEMLDWAAYLALRMRDTDAGDNAAAGEFRDSFDLSVKKARQISLRKLFTPLGWGFGRAGWSWER